MTDHTRLVERLRFTSQRYKGGGAAEICQEAADAIASLAAEIKHYDRKLECVSVTRDALSDECKRLRAELARKDEALHEAADCLERGIYDLRVAGYLRTANILADCAAETRAALSVTPSCVTPQDGVTVCDGPASVEWRTREIWQSHVVDSRQAKVTIKWGAPDDYFATPEREARAENIAGNALSAVVPMLREIVDALRGKERPAPPPRSTDARQPE